MKLLHPLQRFKHANRARAALGWTKTPANDRFEVSGRSGLIKNSAVLEQSISSMVDFVPYAWKVEIGNHDHCHRTSDFPEVKECTEGVQVFYKTQSWRTEHYYTNFLASLAAQPNILRSRVFVLHEIKHSTWSDLLKGSVCVLKKR